MEIQHTNFGNISIIRCGFHEGKYDYGSHLHQFCELIFVLDGEIEITTDGNRQCARCGDIAVITPFCVHSFNTPRYCRIWICVLSNDFVDTVSFEELCQRRERAVFTPSPSLVGYIEHIELSEKCFNFYKNPTTCAHHTLRSVFYLILSEYLNSALAVKNLPYISTLSKILVYISEHFTDDISQESVGKALGYSPRYLSNCFEAIPNINFRTLLNSLRVECAKNLLINTDKSVTDIALESGFTSDRSFHRAFLAIVGMTPGEYRKSKRGGK